MQIYDARFGKTHAKDPQDLGRVTQGHRGKANSAWQGRGLGAGEQGRCERHGRNMGLAFSPLWNSSHIILSIDSGTVIWRQPRYRSNRNDDTTCITHIAIASFIDNRGRASTLYVGLMKFKNPLK